MQYDNKNHCWRTSYHWIVDPNSLSNNYSTALGPCETPNEPYLRSTSGPRCMESKRDRHVFRKFTPQELEEWKGPLFYISRLAVVNPRSNSTLVRIVFNSSQSHHRVSLNSCLAKRPDAYINNLIGVLPAEGKSMLLLLETWKIVALKLAQNTENMLLKDGFVLKCQQFSGEEKRVPVGTGTMTWSWNRSQATGGQPWLVILNDGSNVAYGFVANIRWLMRHGNPWSRLIMTKCRVAPPPRWISYRRC